MAPDRNALPREDPAGGNDPERLNPGLLPRAGGEEFSAGGGPLDLSAIRAPKVAPDDRPDDFTLEQLLEFTPKQKAEYQQIKLVRRLEDHIQIVRAERDGHKQDCRDRDARIESLRHELIEYRIDNVTLNTTRRGDRWKDAVVAIASLVGAGFISSYSRGDGGFAFGWSLLALSCLYQLGRSIANTP